MSVEDVRELVDEGLEAVGQTLDLVGVAVVGDDGRDGGKEADGGGDQGLGDAGGHGGQGGLLHVGQAAEGVHDAPDGAEQADVGADRAG